MLRILVLVVLLALAACQAGPAPRSAMPGSVPGLAGLFDNHEQAWAARQAASMPVPAVRLQLDEPATGWSVWQVQVEGERTLQAVWAFRLVQETGSVRLVPYRPPAPEAAFDTKTWIALDACALSGRAAGARLQVSADPAACGLLAPGLGPDAALLPLAVEREGEWLRVRLYADLARGPDARAEARRVREYRGWAAVNGAGPDASADSRDWHLQQDLVLGSEGGEAALRWRDGGEAGWSLRLERLTFQEGSVPVLRLAAVDNADGSVLAYAWADPDARRIGLNLGWLQVGLEREAPAR